MALYLDNQTRSYLERLVKDIPESDFIGKRLQKMLETDRQRLAELAECDHVKGTYSGKKECCSKCGSFFEPGMGESWHIDDRGSMNANSTPVT